jgi:hypothetical protein
LDIYYAATDSEVLDKSKWRWLFFPICFCIFYPLVLVRKIEPFAKFHVFGDIMIWITLIVCMGYAINQVVTEGWTWKEASPSLPAFNKS